MTTAEHYNELLGTKGISLERFGLREVALDRKDTLLALQFLRDALIGVLGGDVYFRRGETIEIARENWHCDPGKDESAEDFIRRSLVAAENYVRGFREVPGVTPLFVLVAASFVPSGHSYLVPSSAE